ncbi:MAG: aminoacyl-histidine dipeptidase [Bacteroidales bacterium]|nr:aminoacyl-histidine dipeptidase [Bacteroidales bacterium]
MSELSKLYPKDLWENFANICAIPHPSKHEEKLVAWMMNWAKDHNIECKKDKTGNLIFSKPATKGMEDRMPVILQAHVDMVPQANASKKHDFTKDPIEPRVCEDGWVRANGTTLGADDGIGGAAALAVLAAKNVAHGPLEVLLTVDEETGMTGAFGLKKGALKGEILINLDSETEGELYVGCAGGLDGVITMDYRQTAVPAGMKGYQIVITGLNGGHSGMDINLGRANANKLMTRLLSTAAEKCGIRVASFVGGNLRNAIPREAVAVVAVPEENEKALTKVVNAFAKTAKAEFSATEPNMSIKAKAIDTPAKVMPETIQNKVLDMVFALPNGVLRMSDSMPGLVETSNNLAVVNAQNGKVQIISLMRSSVDSAKDAVGQKMTAVARLAGAEISLEAGYPGWKPNMESPILQTAKKVYKDKFKKEPAFMAIHAGLECALFSVNYPNWDMISFGPTIMHPHSPDERVNIESVGKFWDFIVALLKNIPKKK